MAFRIESDTTQLKNDFVSLSTLGQQLNTTIKDAKITFADFSSSGDALGAKLQQVTSDGRIFITTFKDVNGVMKEMKQDFVGLQAPISTISSQFLRFLGFRFAFKELSNLLGSFKTGINDAAELSKKVAEIQTISQGSNIGGEGALTHDVLEISQQSGQGTKQVTEGIYQALSSGLFKGKDALDATAKSMDFFRVTGTNAGTGMKVLTGVINANALSTRDLLDVQGTLFSVVENGATRIENLNGVMGKLGVIAHNAGISLAEQAAALDTLTQKGVDPHTAGTFLTNIITTLQKGGKDLRKMFADEGVASVEAFIGKFKGLGGAIQHIMDQVASGKEDIAKLFPNIRGLEGILALSDGMKGYEENLAKSRDGTNRLDKATEIAANSMGARIDQLKQAWSNFFTEVGRGTIILGSLPMQALGLPGFSQDGPSERETQTKSIEKQLSLDKKDVEKQITNELAAQRQQLAEKLAAQYKIIDAFHNEEALVQRIKDKETFGGFLESMKKEARETENELQKVRRLIDDITKAERLTAVGGLGSTGLQQTLFDEAKKFESNPRRQIELVSQEITAFKQEQQRLIQQGDADSLRSAEKLNAAIISKIRERFELQSRLQIQNAQNALKTDPLLALQTQLSGGTLEVPIDLRNLEKEITKELERQRDVRIEIKTIAKQFQDVEEEKKKKQDASIKTASEAFTKIEALSLTDKSGKPKSQEDQVKAYKEFLALSSVITTTPGGSLAERLNIEKLIHEQKVRLINEASSIEDAKRTEREQKELSSFQKVKIERAKAKLDEEADVKLGKSGKEAIPDLKALQTRVREADDLHLLSSYGERITVVRQLQENINALKNLPISKENYEASAKSLQTVVTYIQSLIPRLQESGEAPKELIQALQEIEKNVALDQQRAAADALTVSLEKAGKALSALVGPEGVSETTIGSPSAMYKRYATGGMVYGSAGIDTNLAALTSGEYVVNANSTGKFFSQLEAINAGRAPEMESSAPTSSTNVGDINVTVSQGSTQEQTARNIGYALRREIRRKTLTFD